MDEHICEGPEINDCGANVDFHHQLGGGARDDDYVPGTPYLILYLYLHRIFISVLVAERYELLICVCSSINSSRLRLQSLAAAGATRWLPRFASRLGERRSDDRRELYCCEGCIEVDVAADPRMEFLDPRDVAVWSALFLFLAQLLADTFGLSAVGPRSDA